jgi:uncharacterized membrane protein
VLAIIITILVLEFDVPSVGDFSALWEDRYHFIVYIVSFLTIAIYWINHHHLLQVTHHVSGTILWWNIILLLFLSVFPFSTAWVSNFPSKQAPELFYAVVMLLADITWVFLARALVKENGVGSTVARALEGSKKSQITITLIILSIIAGLFFPYAAIIGCILSLLPWLNPDEKMENLVKACNADGAICDIKGDNEN